MTTYRNKDIFMNGSSSYKVNNMTNSSTNGLPQVKSSRQSICQCVYIGKVKNSVSNVDIREDRIVLVNTHNLNATTGSKFNITIPFIEITALRYCFDSDISIIVIQPIYESYEKLSAWIQNSNPVSRIVPENFIMIHFVNNIVHHNELFNQNFNNIHRDARNSNQKIKIIEINAVFAHSYLNTPNKLNTRTIRNIPKSTATEVIHLDDDDEDEEPKNDSTLLHRTILKYPENASTQIIICGNDLNCLRDGQYLNDNIMNFYLKFFQHATDFGQTDEDVTSSLTDRIHIYDTLFSARLLHQRKRKVDLSDQGNYAKKFVVYSAPPFAETYQKELKKWTKDVDIFSKDFLVIPLIKDSHWFLVILCYIGSTISQKNGQFNENNSNASLPKPTIIFMDSLNSGLGAPYTNYRQEIIRAIAKYLEQELKEKRKNVGPIDWIKELLALHPKVPQQQNFYDCGLFVIEYIEQFLKNPEKIYKTILNDPSSLQKWFLPKSLSTKRAKIRQIILNLLPPEDAVRLESELLQMNLKEQDAILPS